ncbi:MAG TPA: SRPBCC family protein [Gemmataceae bacterium]|jgi:choline monooxygenase|nr:SRPBCC family protein [Gemmataceae bacterium]
MAALRDMLSAFDPDLPLERARTIPSRWYRDQDVYALECQTIFGDTWQVAGRAALVAEPGSFLTTEIAGEPILVVRDDAGVLRAFFNVCRHRASPVMTESAGKAARLRCRYHGWTYDLAGRLRGTPEFDGVADFCRDDQGLAGLTVAEWGPFVWIYAGDRPPPLDEYLAPLPERIAAEVSGLRFVARREYDLACNWKVFVDNFLDGGYHVNTVHPGLAGVLDYRHYRTSIYTHASVQLSPVKPSEASTVASVRGGGLAQYWWLFPNLMLNLYAGVMDTNLVLPLGPDRCRVVFDFWFADTAGPAADQFMHESMAVAHQIQLEDVGICEEVQRGLASRSFDTGRFSVRREIGGYHFHQLLARRLQAGTP